MAKILLIEDDVELAEHIRDSLTGFNHQVDHTSDGKDGLKKLTSLAYALAIVDWNLPSMEGSEICAQFRAQGGATPILMLTGKQDTADVVRGLESGADDYLTKPFAMNILRARLRALLRRQPDLVPNTLALGELELDSLTSEILIKGKPVKTTRIEFSILELLMQQSGRYISSEAILSRVWSSDTTVSPESVRCHITRLKKRLAAVSPSCADMIQSNYGRGYKIELP